MFAAAAPLVEGIATKAIPFAINAGLMVAGDMAIRQGGDLLDKSGLPGIPANPFKGNAKVTGSYQLDDGETALNITNPDGTKVTKRVDASNVAWTKWGDMATYNKAKEAALLEKRQDKARTNLIGLNELPPSAKQKAQYRHDKDITGMGIRGAQGIADTQVGGQVQVATINKDSASEAVQSGERQYNRGIDFKETELQALTRQAERKQALDERIQGQNELSADYDRRAQFARSQQEVEAAQYAWRRGLPEGLATAAAGLGALFA